ncbi:hypothetical protein TNCV_1012751 [Trichonephila clavipes]|uniref:Uncharacterized protein n=1 Tax=Trichonephila clavipes TaxID=2585209 RepID=A0A8X6VXF1_TRICX|nr:hypothetical protein TNCV_1012751 [Trichonephila clavipes]
MSYDYTACKRSLECLFGLGALGKINSKYRFTSSKLRCLPLGRKLVVKTTCSDWYPPVWSRTKKRHQLPGNVLSVQRKILYNYLATETKKCFEFIDESVNVLLFLRERKTEDKERHMKRKTDGFITKCFVIDKI